MKKRPLFLVGLPGSGKSTLGYSLAKYLHWDFIDLDSEIEKSEDMPISEIFSNKGEVEFRNVESECLRKFESQNVVMATGGGTPCFHNNMDYMTGHGLTVFLDVSLPVITSRLQSEDQQKRPLFDGKNIKEALEELNLKRRPFYERAHHSFKEQSDLEVIFETIKSNIS